MVNVNVLRFVTIRYAIGGKSEHGGYLQKVSETRGAGRHEDIIGLKELRKASNKK
jgi:hypothetical protein